MSSEYDRIRTTIHQSLSLDNLRGITNLSLKILQDGAPKHPAVFLVLAALSRWVADVWDNIPLPTQVADRVERQLKPHLESLLNVANGDPDEVCAVLNAAADAFREAIRRGLDSDLT